MHVCSLKKTVKLTSCLFDLLFNKTACTIYFAGVCMFLIE